MFLIPFKIAAGSIIQIFILGAIGYFLVRKGILGQSALGILGRLVIEVTLPLLIFARLIADFRFDLYPHWWIFPLLGIGIIFLGVLVSGLFLWLIGDKESKRQFLSLVMFQNSGYLPLPLMAAYLTIPDSSTMFIYIFLFLTGFNLLMWSIGVHLLNYHPQKRFELTSLFSPPVIAVLVGLLFVALNWARFLPAVLLSPMSMLGDSTLPLALLVVGGNLASFKIKHIQIKPMLSLILAKLVIMPLIGLWIAAQFQLGHLLGLLLVTQLAMPSATSLSVITSGFQKKDILISQGIFITHLVSIVTIPIFLSLV